MLLLTLALAAIVAGGAAFVMLSDFPPETRTTEKILTDVSIKP